MALLARARSARTPRRASSPTRSRVLAPLLAEIHERGIKVVTNAGALNPAACARALPRRRRARPAWRCSVAAIEGDDLMPAARRAARLPAPRDMFTGEPLPGRRR